MTRFEALKKMIMLWTYLADYPGKTMAQAYFALGLTRDRNLDPLCQYSLNGRKVNCIVCPFFDKWGWGCTDNYHYWRWANYSTTPEATQSARILADLARQKLCEAYDD